MKSKYRDFLLNKIIEKVVEKSQMCISVGLTKVRQIFNTTQLIDKDYENCSIKLKILY